MNECRIENGVKCVTHDSYDVRQRCSVRIAALEHELTLREQAIYWNRACVEAQEDRDRTGALLQIVERDLVAVRDQARQEIADIADGRTPSSENSIFDAISVIQAFRGPMWKDLAAAHARIAALTGALESEYLAGVEWGIRHTTAYWNLPMFSDAGFPELKAQALLDRASLRPAKETT